MTSSSKDSSPEPPVSAWKGLVAVGILLVILIGFVGYSSWQRARTAEENTYNGFPFAHSGDNLWVTRIEVAGQPYNFPFYYHPREIEDILLDASATLPILEYPPEQIVISVHPDAGSKVVIAAVEISRITGNKYNLLNIPTRSALSALANNTVDIPVVTCADATNRTTVIQFIHADKDAIVREGYCVMLLYTTPDSSIRVADRFAYRLLRIMY